MTSNRIKFRQEIGAFAVIQGTVQRIDDVLEFELSMTESIEKPVSGIVRRSIKLTDLESIEFKRRFFRKSKLVFSSVSLGAFERIPNSKGFTYTVLVDSSAQQAKSFVGDALFEMAHIEMEELGKRFE
jgi:hypothetical protein